MSQPRARLGIHSLPPRYLSPLAMGQNVEFNPRVWLSRLSVEALLLIEGRG
jgi:hypothetical protein